MVTENLKSVEERIQAACDRAGRDRRDVKLVCVTKTKPLPLLQEAYADGQRDFGENKVQEILAKKPQLPIVSISAISPAMSTSSGVITMI